MALLVSPLLLSTLLFLPFLLATPLPAPPPLQQLIADADTDAHKLTTVPTPTPPLPPSLDPWYRAPYTYDWTQTDPGRVLKVRAVPTAHITIGSTRSAYQLLYRTTDSAYNASWAVTTLLLPYHGSFPLQPPSSTPQTAQQIKLLSYQLPYDTCNVDASPSYSLRVVGEPYGEIGDALALGWAVAVPDYEGPLASYAAGVQAGHATLDGVRAAVALLDVLGPVLGLGKRTNSGSGSEQQPQPQPQPRASEKPDQPTSTTSENPTVKVALWGYSGGALASEWAAELSVQYAPRLALAGVALGGLTPNVTSVTDYLNARRGAGLIPSGLLGIATQHPDAQGWIVSRLKPGAWRDRFLSVKGMTAAQAIDTFQYENIFDYFEGGYEDLHTGVMDKMYDVDGYMGYHGVPGMPMFVYNAIHDELSDIRDVDALVDRYCGVGANILYQRNTVGTHVQEQTNGQGRAFAWLRSVLDGDYDQVYSSMGCTIQNVTINLAPWTGWLA